MDSQEFKPQLIDRVKIEGIDFMIDWESCEVRRVSQVMWSTYSVSLFRT